MSHDRETTVATSHVACWEVPLSRVPHVPDAETWARPEPVYAALQPVLDGIARALFRLDIDGLERIPEHGPALLVANHVSHLDPLVLFSVCTRAGRRPRFLALADLWHRPVLGWLLERGHMIPVFRGRGREAAERMIAGARRALDAGQLVVVYPEGQLPQPGQPQRPRWGAGQLALAARDPVLPVAMAGVPPWTGRPPRPRARVRVRIGAPLELEDLRSSPVADRELEAARRATAAFERLADGD